jgi:hypothetical protein
MKNDVAMGPVGAPAQNSLQDRVQLLDLDVFVPEAPGNAGGEPAGATYATDAFGAAGISPDLDCVGGGGEQPDSVP